VVEVTVGDDDRFRVGYVHGKLGWRGRLRAVVQKEPVVDENRTSADLASATQKLDSHRPLLAGRRP
jgi:hypothetical protein